MKSEEAMLKLQSITKLEPLSGVVGFEPVVTQRRRRSPVCVVEPLTGGWRSNGDRRRRSPVCVVEPLPLTGGWRSNSTKKKASPSSKCWSLEVDRWLETWSLGG
ncbi:hypothetical protein L2E82_34232 [Cichorium intybus]|uniref:Uncharacterized protein n=1 Tax=Cichorium intybus TaxID=13427 RepID=A0ACB9BLY2_CICIN|nr:hypothetical protein L2E82_34232 [Cichorium intybus]